MMLVRANRAVVFASGGFTHSERYAREYLNGMYVGGCAARTNEEDSPYLLRGETLEGIGG
jgi:hypothetical protein